MNSFCSYYKLIIVISLLSQITQPMQSNSLSTRDKVIICIIIPALFATAYGFYTFLDWFTSTPTNSPRISSSIQSIGNIRASGGINLKQYGASDTKNPSLFMSTLQGTFSVNQSGGFMVNQKQTKSGQELSINCPTLALSKIIAQGRSQIYLHQAPSVGEQKMTLTSHNNDLQFCIDIKDGILNYTCSNNSTSTTMPQLQIWVHDKSKIQFQLEDSI